MSRCRCLGAARGVQYDASVGCAVALLVCLWWQPASQFIRRAHLLSHYHLDTGNPIGDEGAKALAVALPKMSVLEDLIVAGLLLPSPLAPDALAATLT